MNAALESTQRTILSSICEERERNVNIHNFTLTLYNAIMFLRNVLEPQMREIYGIIEYRASTS